MQPRQVVANGKVTDDRDKVAFERGPLVYCAESADNQGANPLHVLLTGQPQWTVESGYSIQNTEADGSPFTVTALVTTDAQLADIDSRGKLKVITQSLRLIPYYAWCHRGTTCMTVWFAQRLGALED